MSKRKQQKIDEENERNKILQFLGGDWKYFNRGSVSCLKSSSNRCQTDFFHSFIIKDQEVWGKEGSSTQRVIDINKKVVLPEKKTDVKEKESSSRTSETNTTSANGGSFLTSENIVLIFIIMIILCCAYLLIYYLTFWLILFGILIMTKPTQDSFKTWFNQKMKENGAGSVTRWITTNLVLSVDESEFMDLKLFYIAMMPNTNPPWLFIGIGGNWIRLK